MSSMRNAVQRRPHRERAQPLERKRLGLLEKHKDYSLRAKDYNKKKEHLQKLRQKASERNEDEFYFGMLSRDGPGSRIMDGKSWKGTVKGDRGNKTLDMSTARLLKTQDVGYVRTMKQIVRKEVARLEQQVVLTSQVNGLDNDDQEDFDDDDDDEEFSMPLPALPKAPKKIVFADDEDEREAIMDADMEDEDDDDADSDGIEEDDDGKTPQSDAKRTLQRLKTRLENERKKLKVLTDAERELDIQRGNMAKKGTVTRERRGKKMAVRTRKR